MGGYIKIYDSPYNFTYLTIRDAGHLVPQYQLAAALSMLKYFIKNEPFPKFTGVPSVKIYL